jgi:hypothetical protein
VSYAIDLLKYLQEKNIRIIGVYLTGELRGQQLEGLDVSDESWRIGPGHISAQRRIGKYIRLREETNLLEQVTNEITITVPVEKVVISTPDYEFYVARNKNVWVSRNYEQEEFKRRELNKIVNGLRQLGYRVRIIAKKFP